ncbi:flagellar basal body rod protein FlgB [Crenobacter sp. SG2303]|uniref:Flagellar basal body rod protein FlgB n=1 Tax=Crenobacter oryzisoli TaxID=3056844 RepID=A0ABT7XKP0_9NEIS|nr:flagellar basal body rod protein FlgB [Crenobacter sp. SG2303]MDN0074273.1 flagellar basal body rod protein FlgB [Crenobacter sp. SG2303]
MLDKIAKHFDFQQRALDTRAQRAEVIASNIANADTPYYKAVDLDFKAAMQAAAGNGQKTLALATTSPQHINGGGLPGFDDKTALLYRSQVQPSLDGNTVDMDIERAQFTDNAMKYQASLTFLNRRIANLSEAIKGGQ